MSYNPTDCLERHSVHAIRDVFQLFLCQTRRHNQPRWHSRYIFAINFPPTMVHRVGASAAHGGGSRWRLMVEAYGCVCTRRIHFSQRPTATAGGPPSSPRVGARVSASCYIHTYKASRHQSRHLRQGLLCLSSRMVRPYP